MDNNEIIALWRNIMHNPTIERPYFDREPAIKNVPTSNNTIGSPFTVYQNDISGSNGARLAQVHIVVDTNFQSDFYWTFFLDGITGQSGKTFLPWDPNSTTFDAVPAGDFIYLKPGATLQIQAYNEGGGMTAGSMSVYVISDQLNEYQASIKKKYDTLMAQLGSQL